MGNVAVASPASSSSADGKAAYSLLNYKGTTYEPSQYQVDLAYAEVMNAYCNITKRWYGVNKELLLRRLQSKIKENHPELYSSFLRDIILRQNEDIEEKDTRSAIVGSSSTKKRRKVEVGPIIFHGHRVPKEVLARVVLYSDRSSMNNLSYTSRGPYEIIYQDSRIVKKIPWPCHCPWPKTAQWDRTKPIASMDGSLLAAHRKGHWRSQAGWLPNYYHIGIYDRFHGLIGEIDRDDVPYDVTCMNEPIFSPDGQLLLAPWATEDVPILDGRRHVRGVQVVQIQSTKSDKRPISVSTHTFHGGEVISIAFINNDMIAVVEADRSWEQQGSSSIGIWEIHKDNGVISFTFSHKILEGSLQEPERRYKINSYVSESKTFLAIFSAAENRLFLYEYNVNGRLVIIVPQGERIDDIAFSKDGNLVVSSGTNHGPHQLYIYDFKVETIGEVGSPRIISLNGNIGSVEIISFSVDSTKVALRNHGGRIPEARLVDLQTGEVISTQFLNESDWDHSAWDSFIN